MSEENRPVYDSEHVRALRAAENQFLQVLVTRFRLIRNARGLVLEVAFDRDSPALWSDRGKLQVGSLLPRSRRAEIQASIDDFIGGNAGRLDHRDAAFPFRLGNGGTLPVVHMEGTDYFCLFYRDAEPAGWNIANGGANDIHDLLHPDAIIERELREELVIVDPDRRLRYVFDWHSARLRDHPDFARADELWRARFRARGLGELQNIRLPLKWLPPVEADPGFDDTHEYDSIRVAFGEEDEVHTGRGFLNINAEDFGIEFDRIAKLCVGPEAVFCDGELRGRELLNRVVGLFRVETMLDRIDEGRSNFLPDRVYWDGKETPAEEAEETIVRSLQRRRGPNDSDSRLPGKDPVELDLDLCPVTRNVIRRFRQLVPQTEPPPPPGPFDAFLSFGSPDLALARRVHAELSEGGRRSVFFSDTSIGHGPFGEQIDRALDRAKALVVVASQPDHLERPWVRYEWGSYHNDILSRRRAPATPMIAFVQDIPVDDLPRPFRERNSIIDADRVGWEPAAEKLRRMIVTA